jgi:hypothetical protein
MVRGGGFMNDDAFNKWFDKRINEETLPTIEESFESGRNSMLAELRAKVPSDSEIDEHLTALVNHYVDSNERVYVRFWMFKSTAWLKQKIFGGVDE